jgi:hypothetical protein
MNIGLNITQPNNIVLILGDASPFEWEMKHQAMIFSPVANQLVGGGQLQFERNYKSPY